MKGDSRVWRAKSQAELESAEKMKFREKSRFETQEYRSGSVQLLRVENAQKGGGGGKDMRRKL